MKKLDISDCVQIQDDVISKITRITPNLVSLKINRLNNINHGRYFFLGWMGHIDLFSPFSLLSFYIWRHSLRGGRGDITEGSDREWRGGRQSGCRVFGEKWYKWYGSVGGRGGGGWREDRFNGVPFWWCDWTFFVWIRSVPLSLDSISLLYITPHRFPSLNVFWRSLSQFGLHSEAL